MRRAIASFLFLIAAAVQASAQPFIYVATGGTRTEDLIWQIAFTPRIAVLDAASGSVIANIPMPDCTPGDLAFRPDGTRLFATCARTGSTALLSIDPSTGQILQNVVYSGTVTALRLAPDAARLYAINQTSQTVLFIDAATLAVTRQIAQAGAGALDISGDGSRLYVAGFLVSPGHLARTVNVFDTATGAEVSGVITPLAPRLVSIDVAPTGEPVVQTDSAGAMTIGGNSISFTAAGAAGNLSLARPAFDWSGGRAYVSVRGGNPSGIAVIDLTSRAITRIDTIAAPGTILLSSARDRLYVADTAHLSVAILDLSRGGAAAADVDVAGDVLSMAEAPAGVNPPQTPCGFDIFTITPQFIGAIQRPLADPRGSAGRIGVRAFPDRCAWTASADVPWITLASSGGAGVKAVPFTIEANGTGAVRTGHILIGGQTLTVTQAACADPVVIIDTPPNGSTVAQPYRVAGWAIDRCALSGTGMVGPDIRGMVTSGYGKPRPDVAAIFGPQFLNSGFDAMAGFENGPGAISDVGVTFFVLSTGAIAHAPLTLNMLPGRRPFGVIDTPAQNGVVSGEMALTGWALDDVRITGNIAIYRDAVAGEAGFGAGGRVFIGNATRLAGSRPDLAPFVPGWRENDWGFGLMVLTNVLPNGGNGTFTFTADVSDGVGTTTLGPRTVTANNAASQVPFGTIDTPAQGATVSGAIVNFGWVLGAGSNVIPTDGSTIDVVVDGAVVGHPTYNQFRGDIAGAFPNAANASGAVGFFILDTTRLSNGLHTIGWVARDAAGHTSGLGSRFFTVNNQ